MKIKTLLLSLLLITPLCGQTVTPPSSLPTTTALGSGDGIVIIQSSVLKQLTPAQLQAYLQASMNGGLTISTTTGTFTLVSGKTLTVDNTITLSGTDGSTLNIGGGGSLGSAAYTASSSYEPALGNPAGNNYVLISNMSGTRSWMSPSVASGALIATNNLGDLTNVGSAQTHLALVPGVNVEVWNTNLDTLAAGNPFIAGAGTSITGTYPALTFGISPATVSNLGGVVVGPGLSVTVGGTLSASVLSVAGRTGTVVLSSADISGLGALATMTPGTGVATATGTAVNTAGGLVSYNYLGATPALGAATATSVNGIQIATASGTLTLGGTNTSLIVTDIGTLSLSSTATYLSDGGTYAVAAAPLISVTGTGQFLVIKNGVNSSSFGFDTNGNSELLSKNSGTKIGFGSDGTYAEFGSKYIYNITTGYFTYPSSSPNPTLRLADGTKLYDPSGEVLADNSGNLYSSLPAGSIMVAGGAGVPISAAADDTTVPTNPAVPVGYLHIQLNGTDAWVPYFQ